MPGMLRIVILFKFFILIEITITGGRITGKVNKLIVLKSLFKIIIHHKKSYAQGHTDGTLPPYFHQQITSLDN